MTLTVDAIINNARDMHAVLSVQAAPVPVALRFLSRTEGDLVRDITSRIPAFLALELIVALPLASFEDGIDLATELPNGWQDLVDVFLKYSNSPNPPGYTRAISVPWEQRDARRTLPAWTIRNNVIYLLGQSSDYTNYSEVKLSYTPIPTNFAGPQSVTILPDDALDCLSAMLAGFWLQRLAGMPMYQIKESTAQYFVDVGMKARKEFLTRIFRLSQRQSYRVRDVGGGGGA